MTNDKKTTLCFFTLIAIITIIIWLVAVLSEQCRIFFAFFFNLSFAGIIGVAAAALMGIFSEKSIFICAKHNISKKLIPFLQIIYICIYIYMLGIWSSYCAGLLSKIQSKYLIENYWLYFIVALLFVTWPNRVLKRDFKQEVKNTTDTMTGRIFTTALEQQKGQDFSMVKFSKKWRELMMKEIREIRAQATHLELLVPYTIGLFILCVVFPNLQTLFLGDIIPHIFITNTLIVTLGTMSCILHIFEKFFMSVHVMIRTSMKDENNAKEN